MALVASLMASLARARPALRRTVVAVFIANEENSRKLGVGVDELVRQASKQLITHVRRQASPPVFSHLVSLPASLLRHTRVTIGVVLLVCACAPRKHCNPAR